MKNLCFVMLQFKIGGCERVFCSLASMLPRKIYLVTINENYDKEMLEKLPLNVEILSLSHIRWINKILSFQKHKFCLPFIRLFTLFIKIIYLRKKFKDEHISIVNFSDTLSSLFLTVTISCKSNCFSWIHCNPVMLKKSSCFMFYKHLLRKCKIICICEEQKELLLNTVNRIDPLNVYVSYNPIDKKQIMKDASKELQIHSNFLLMVSRIDLRSKDFYTLIDAYESLPIAIQNNYPLYLIGDGPDRPKIETYINERGLTNSVILYGKDDNPYRWMKRCALFIFSSKNEGLPTVLLEAMACGALILSTDCQTGPKEILQNGKCGILVPVGDVKKMRAALLDILSPNFNKKILLENANKRIQDFGFASVYNHLFKLGLF